jgi:hypothetical protein
MGLSETTKTRLGVIAALVVTGFGIGWLAGLSVSPVVSIVISSVLGTAAAVVAVVSGLEPTATDGEKTAPLRQFLGLQPKAWPLMWLVVGIAVGAMVGIRARNYHWFGSDLSSELAKWEAADPANNAIARRLFELQYPYTPYVRSKTLLDQDLAAEYTRWLNATGTLTNTAQPALIDEVTKRLLDLEYPPLTYLEAINRTAAASTNQTTVRGTGLLGSAAATTSDLPSECTDLRGKRGQDLRDQLNKSAWGELTSLVTDTAKLDGVVEVICRKR